jgi:hypothetical protein
MNNKTIKERKKETKVPIQEEHYQNNRSFIKRREKQRGR